MDQYSLLVESLFYLRSKDADINWLHNALGSPALSYPTVHIAGTNGKGSVAIKTATILELSGYRVGLYTSPHIESYRERIKINGEMISRDHVVHYLDFLKEFLEKRWQQYNFFELTTMMAFLYFRDMKVDVAVIETGIGGRYDATNVVHPLVSVITTISKDHESELGNTLNAIAYQKAGIIKQNVPVVVGYRGSYPPVMEEAFKKNAPIIFNSLCQSDSYSIENQLIVKEVVKVLANHFTIPSSAEKEGLLKEQACRFEIHDFPHVPTFILDVAHNMDGLNQLHKRLKKGYPDKDIHVIFGISKDKDHLSCVQEIVNMAKSVQLLNPLYNKGLSNKDLIDVFLSLGHEPRSATSASEAIDRCICLDKSKNIVVVCGTFYIMDEVKRALTSLKPSKTAI
ncbi:MAG: bifunctional folylpolyglutamate synthase/dihydrofolate synthase [Chlamydiae bacterium]|nr:bifunctional folylpolyglutamate synthase/dihydrofolate synthase [Chlamydiota bacterium]